MNRRAHSLAIPALLALVAALSATSGARAAEPLGIEAPTPSPPAPGGTDQAVVARYWEIGRTRPFLAGTVDAGFLYLKPRFSAGYGRPFWSFVAAEGYPVVGTGGLGLYSGFSAAIPGLTFRLGSRYYYPFSRTLLRPQPSFTRSDLDLELGPAGDYMAFESELTFTLPAFRGSLFGVLSGYRTARVPQNYYVFEDSLRVVMAPPYVWRTRLGYLASFGARGAIRFGGAAELIGLPGRDEIVMRAGVLASVSISAELEAQASLIPVILSPDSIGLAGGDFGQLGLRYRWATDSTPDPERLRDAVEKSGRP